MSAGQPLVSVVLSFRNERDTIPALVARLAAMFTGQPVDYEILFVNDASTDGSVDVLMHERERNPRVKIINMARRCGVAECVLAGMAAASGDAVVYMDADLQDPPEIIPQLLERWRGGADVVHTVRTRRHGESGLKIALTRLAYRAINYGSTIELPIDAGDFKLLSRAAVGRLLTLGESDPYLRGLAVWIASNQAFVPYERAARHAGRTHFPFFSRNPWKTFAMGLTSFSSLPKLPIYACVILSALGFAAAAVLLVAAPVLAAAGSTAVVPAVFGGAVLVFWSTIVGAVGASGLFVIRIYKDVRRRPRYFVESTVGLPAAQSAEVEKVAP
ncbi:MAG: glycosyltransferase family 2 protein [Acidobacteria bacterium]|nr:glycosyltransferase family 2 protein [Acidobacteriota bacterium]